MTGRALPPNTDRFTHVSPAPLAAAGWDISPGDRIGAPLHHRRGRLVRRGLLLAAIAGAGAVHWADPGAWPRWWSAASATIAPLVERARQAGDPSLPQPQTTAPASAAEAASAPPLQPQPTPVEAPAPPLEAAPPPARAALPSSLPPAVAAPTAAAPAAPSEGPRAGAAGNTPAATASAPMAAGAPGATTDPLRRRAEAAGLNPDLSPMLLARLSETDLRNAAVAIRTAVAETPDEGSHIWPRQRTAGLAQFRVHFVAGAATHCRRYIVTVAKDGWLTTAPPMERCGTAARPARGAAPRPASRP